MEIHICVACTIDIAVVLVTVCQLPLCAECYGQWLNLSSEYSDTPALNSEKE